MLLAIDNLHLDIQYHRHRPEDATELEQVLKSLVVSSFEQLSSDIWGGVDNNLNEALLLPDIHIDLPQIDFNAFMQTPMDYFYRFIFPKIEQSVRQSVELGMRQSRHNASQAQLVSGWREIKSGLLYSRGIFFDVNTQQLTSRLLAVLLQCLHSNSSNQQALKSWILLPKCRKNMASLLAIQKDISDAAVLIPLLFSQEYIEQQLHCFLHPVLSVKVKQQMWQLYLEHLSYFSQHTAKSMEYKKQALLLSLQTYALALTSKQDKHQAKLDHIMGQLRHHLKQGVNTRLFKAMINWINIVEYQGINEGDITGLTRLLDKSPWVQPVITQPKWHNFTAVKKALGLLLQKLAYLSRFSGTDLQLQVTLAAIKEWLQQAWVLPADIIESTLKALALFSEKPSEVTDFHGLERRFSAVLNAPLALSRKEIISAINRVLSFTYLPLGLYDRLHKALDRIIKSDETFSLQSPELALLAEVKTWCQLADNVTTQKSVLVSKDERLSEDEIGLWQGLVSCLNSIDFSEDTFVLTIDDKKRLQPLLLALQFLKQHLPTPHSLLVSRFLQTSDDIALQKLIMALSSLEKDQGASTELLDESNEDISQNEGARCKRAGFDSFYQIERNLAQKVAGLLARFIQQLGGDNEYHQMMKLFHSGLSRFTEEPSMSVFSEHCLYRECVHLYLFISSLQLVEPDEIFFLDKFSNALKKQIFVLEKRKQDVTAEGESWWLPLVTVSYEPNIAVEEMVLALNTSKEKMEKATSERADEASLIEFNGFDASVPDPVINIAVLIRQQANLLVSVLALPIMTLQSNSHYFNAIKTWSERSLMVLNVRLKEAKPEDMERGKILLHSLQQLSTFLCNKLLTQSRKQLLNDSVSNNVTTASVPNNVASAGVSNNVTSESVSNNVVSAGVSNSVASAGVSNNVASAGVSNNVTSESVSNSVASESVSNNVTSASVSNRIASVSSVSNVSSSVVVSDSRLLGQCLSVDHHALTRVSQLNVAEIALATDHDQIAKQLAPLAPYHQGAALSLERLASCQSQSLSIHGKEHLQALMKALAVKSQQIHLLQREQEQELISLDGGLLLLWPFLQTFFNQLSLLTTNEKGEMRFVDESAQLTAHALLVHMLVKSSTESVYVVANLLSGLEPDTWVETEIVLNQEDKAACEHLLQAVIGHWKALKTMPIGSFRDMFLFRQVQCVKSTLGYQLVVEKQAQDVLMTKLPWGLGMISLPWLDKQLLQVLW
ncbi:contractile injection system tape measure protein [uncultured Shewanella sp.]|uniref:contractile injection system tape measure protein n=1 Tax=uncultured Shewanella sp. TaxID=173975 RepID=UPI00260A547F|nr:contractile injection system tape measure protein [uncultured Shewanella sp.]